MAWRIEGAGYRYTFPAQFDLQSYSRNINVRGREVHGRDGEVIDPRTTHKAPTTHIISGLIQGSNVAASLAELDEAQRAANALSDEIYLVDTSANRRVKVKLVSANVPREPARVLRCSFTFQTSDTPFWEDVSMSTLNLSSQSWADVPVGDVPFRPEITLRGRIANPTIVQGNWNVCSHMHGAQATAITSLTGESPYGVVPASTGNSKRYFADGKLGQCIGLYGNGIHSAADKLQFNLMSDDSTPGSAVCDRLDMNQGTVAFWIRPNENLADAPDNAEADLYFTAEKQADTNRLRVYRANNGSIFLVIWEDGGGVAVAHRAACGFSTLGAHLRAGQWNLVIARWSSHSAVTGSYLMDLQVYNGSSVVSPNTYVNADVGSDEWTAVAPADTLRIGANTTSPTGADEADQSINAMFDDFAIWNRALTDAEVSTLQTGEEAATLSHGLVAYFTFDGTAGAVVSGTALGSDQADTLAVSSISGATLSVAASGDEVFADSERVVVWDDGATPNVIRTTVSGSPSNATIVVANDCSAATATNKYVSKSLLVDDDMELSNANAWSAQNSASLGKATATLHQGDRSLAVTNGIASQGAARQTVTLAAGENYQIGGWFYAPATINGASRLVEIDSSGTLSITCAQAGVVSGWNHVEHCFEAPDASVTVDLGSGSVASTHVGYWDAVKLLPTNNDTAGCESFTATANGTTITGWSESGASGSDAFDQATNQSETPHSGSDAQYVSASGANIGIQDQTSTVQAGVWYEASCWAKLASGSPGSQIRFHDSVDGALKTFTLTTTYQRCSYVWKHAGVAGRLRILANSQPGVNFVVDNISLRKRPDIDATVTPMSLGDSIRPAKYGFGRLLTGQVYTFPSLIQRTDKFSFSVRLRAQAAWSTLANQAVRTLFDFTEAGSSLSTHQYYLQLQDGRWVFGNSAATIGAQATTYVHDKDLQISGWVDTAGTTIGGVTFKAKLFENDNEIASLATFTQASVATLTQLYIGTDRDYDTPAQCIIDEVYFYHQNMGDDYLKGEGGAQRQLNADNTAFRWASTLASQDYLHIDNEECEIKHYNTSGPTVTNSIASFSGDFFEFGHGTGFGDANTDTLFCRQPMSMNIMYRKRYY